MLICRADIAQRLHLLVLKAKVFAAGGQPIKGFSIALRAASTAERCLLVNVLIEALGVLGAILLVLSEFEAARDLVQAALPYVRLLSRDESSRSRLTAPQALENRDVQLTAQLFTHLGEAYVGISGHCCSHGSSEQARNMRTAETYVECSHEGKLWASHVSCIATALRTHQ